ncbi:hypothetical protein AN641_02030 [Candidatus Epulonipiscioides gigas]|nr:hypothetical protein AN641_02030 [Epulopiscium sp. SCG-C07WGA-EpuloA2]
MKRQSKGLQFFKFFINSFIITLVISFMIMCSGVWAYQHYIYIEQDPITTQLATTTLEAFSYVSAQSTEVKEAAQEVNKTVAILGTDIQGYRTDVIIIANYNSITGKIKLVSIPRDTRVQWTQAQKDMMRKYQGHTMSITKINEMSAYTGIENIDKYALTYVENLLGIDIDNYVIVSLTAFRDIIDAIGGVYVDVPIDMSYSDPYQDLYIDLKAGPQLLDGVKSEQFVRFRKMEDGDVDRIKMQQIFLEAFAEKILSPSIIVKIPSLIQVVFNTVKTDIKLTEIFEYYGYLKDFSLDNLEFHILPGKGQYIGHTSYFIPDMGAIEEFSQDIFYEHIQ